MVIGVEHAASCETFDDAQLLDPEQDQSRPNVIEKLHRDKQDPKRDFVSLGLNCECNTVMSNKHRFI